MNIALTKHFEELIARLVASGRYNNSSQVVRAGLLILDAEEKSISCSVTRMFDGLMSRWMIPFLVRVLNRLANLDEQIEPVLGSEIGLVAVIGDADATHQFHDEIGP